ncbi:hypothetical protein Bbelb_048600 [Branchiostoma belcheri]|nr:hypothetical protein Bbelb_048600 [Branchiostoma belcheri]
MLGRSADNAKYSEPAKLGNRPRRRMQSILKDIQDHDGVVSTTECQPPDRTAEPAGSASTQLLAELLMSKSTKKTIVTNNIDVMVCKFSAEGSSRENVQKDVFDKLCSWMDDIEIHSCTVEIVGRLYPNMRLLASVLMVIPDSTADKQAATAWPWGRTTTTTTRTQAKGRTLPTAGELHVDKGVDLGAAAGWAVEGRETRGTDEELQLHHRSHIRHTLKVRRRDEETRKVISSEDGKGHPAFADKEILGEVKIDTRMFNIQTCGWGGFAISFDPETAEIYDRGTTKGEDYLMIKSNVSLPEQFATVV